MPLFTPDIQAPRLLLVDDDELVLYANMAYLELAGFDVRADNSARTMLADLPAWKPDIVILDIQMPSFNGLECAQILRGQMDYRGLLIALSSLSTKLDELASLGAGFDRHVVKPTDISEMTRYICSNFH